MEFYEKNIGTTDEGEPIIKFIAIPEITEQECPECAVQVQPQECPECTGPNLDETLTICWDCSASDYIGA